MEVVLLPINIWNLSFYYYLTLLPYENEALQAQFRTGVYLLRGEIASHCSQAFRVLGSQCFELSTEHLRA